MQEFGELSLRDKEETHVSRRQRCKCRGLRFGLYKFVKGMGRIRPVCTKDSVTLLLETSERQRAIGRGQQGRMNGRWL